MEAFKISLESLHTSRIKEINYEGEETYQERPTLSQRLTELAQRIDFQTATQGEGEGEEDGEGSEPVTKKAVQKWPWEYTHSKLKQALTEVSVLSDVLQMVHGHRQYLMMNQVMATPTSLATPTYQYIVKKKALGVAAGILRKGTQSLSRVSSHGEREFHRALLAMRQRWRLRRVPNGAIQGDISYHSAGSNYVIAATFEVHKGVGLSSEGGGVISVTVPRNLRGRSEILVFLADQPVREVGSLDLIPPPPASEFIKLQQDLPPWEQKLVAAQNILFNQELFSQLARQAYGKKASLQPEVFSNKIFIPLSTDYWLSVLHVREYDDKDVPKTVQSGEASGFPTPRWALVVALKQLLRENHLRKVSLPPPRPTTAGFTESQELRNAGSSALSIAQMKKLQYDDNIFDRFVEKAKHVYNEERLQQWLSELCSSCNDLILSVTWIPDLRLTSTTANLHFSNPATNSVSCTLELCLEIDKITIHRLSDKVISIYPDKKRILCILRHQVMVHLMQLACQLAEGQKWQVLQRFTHPVLSRTLAKSSGDYMEACNIVLESPDTLKKLDVLLEWSKVSVSLTQYASSVTTADDIAAIVAHSKTFTLDTQPGQTFHQKFTSMLNSLSTA